MKGILQILRDLSLAARDRHVAICQEAVFRARDDLALAIAARDKLIAHDRIISTRGESPQWILVTATKEN